MWQFLCTAQPSSAVAAEVLSSASFVQAAALSCKVEGQCCTLATGKDQWPTRAAWQPLGHTLCPADTCKAGNSLHPCRKQVLHRQVFGDDSSRSQAAEQCWVPREVLRAGIGAGQGRDRESCRMRLVWGKVHWHTGLRAIQDEQTRQQPC